MQKMNNFVQNYAWGSRDALTRLFAIANPSGKPMAELWMGAHPKGSSSITDASGHSCSLRDQIDRDKNAYLGSAVASRFGELPFLFKVLCAAQPLSIQVHPGKSAAQAGFIKENAAGIALDAPERNYKDANHKPELVFAITPFLAMNGFREFSDIVTLLKPVIAAHPAIPAFLQLPDPAHLATLFTALLTLTDKQKSLALNVLHTALPSLAGTAWDAVRKIAQFYPTDAGLFSPLLLNVITLQPGHAMFLPAETPHAYLEGVALEVMANSDNVLRAGLTEKYIDIPELLANVQFIAKPANELLTVPEKNGSEESFPVPIDDFSFSLHKLSARPQCLIQSGAAIVFCLTGQALLERDGEQVVLNAGESCFIAAFESLFNLSGNGRIARVYNQLPEP